MTDRLVKVWSLFLYKDIIGAAAAFLMFVMNFFPQLFSVWRIRSGNLDGLIDVAKEEDSLGFCATLLHSEMSLIPLMIIFTACKHIYPESRAVAKETEWNLSQNVQSMESLEQTASWLSWNILQYTFSRSLNEVYSNVFT